MQQPIEIEPALKGTTFGTALEGALRDEQLKRAARAAEIANPKVIPHARQLAQELRQLSASNPTKDPMSQGIPERKRRPMTAEIVAKLSPTQIGILKAGMESSPFKTGSVGRAIGVMLDLKLIAPTERKGWWTLTEAGKDAYEIHLAQEAAANDQVFKATEGAINLDDPALRDNRPVETWEDVAQARQKIIDDLRLTLDVAEYELHVWRRSEAAIKPMMEEDGLGDTLVEYVTALRQGLANETAIVDDINALAAADGKGHMDPREYVEMLRAKIREYQESATGATLGVYQNIIDTLLNMQQKDGSELKLTDWVADLRFRLHTAESEETLATARQMIGAVLEMMEEDGSHLPLVDYVADLRAHLANKIAIIEQRDSKIESLSRCIEAQQETLNARMVGAVGRGDILLAVQILDELCELIPEVEGYRVAREQAVKAINSLKARRS